MALLMMSYERRMSAESFLPPLLDPINHDISTLRVFYRLPLG